MTAFATIVEVDGGLTIDTHLRVVQLDGRDVVLTKLEHGFLGVLASEPERVFTRDELLSMLWCSAKPRSRSIDALASRLRRKLDRRYVQNVWGVGYRLLPWRTGGQG